MNDTESNQVADTNGTNKKTDDSSKDEIEKAFLKNKLFEGDLNTSPDVRILKEQKSYNNNKIHSKNNQISNLQSIPIAGLNDIRKVCDFTNHDHNKESFTLKKINNVDSNVSEPILAANSSQPKEINGCSVDYKTGSGKIMPESVEAVYYAVHIPQECSLTDVTIEGKDSPHVYTDKEEVLKIIKLNKKARFKQFKTWEEAEEFAINGAEVISQDGSSAIADTEKVMPFKRPKTEEMIQFRKDIEKGDIEAVKEKIFENPKYLVSNGDTPSILQEGSRYNALHVAAKSKNAKVAQLILDSITNISFIGYLYDDKDTDSCVSRSEILLDRYLNTPDKGSNETPLHLAVKHGAVDVVQVLLSYSQCQRNNIYNRYNELPKDIICSRVYGPCEEAKAAIASMLDEQYFVPVLRSEDNSLQPRVGEAFSLSQPLELQRDILSPRLEIQAYAGPMSKEKAELFKRKWKIPSRLVKDATLSCRLSDTEKGLEKTGRNLASELQVPWQEYWPFLDTFVDIASPKGLDLLENYLKTRFQETFNNVWKETIKNSNEKRFCPINDLCETFELCASQEKQSSSPSPRPKRTLGVSSSYNRERCAKKLNDSFKNCGKNPLVYVERSCEVFGNRIGTAISSCVLYDNHVESLKECLETQVKHLLSLVKSYKEDNRFQSINFQLIHSRVAAEAIQSLKDVIGKDKQLILTSLNEIDWSNGALSDDEDLNFNYKSSCDWLGVTARQLHCLVKHLKSELQNFHESGPQLSPSARDETDCQTLWALANPCECKWDISLSKRTRTGFKRKQYRSDGEYDYEILPRKIQFEDEKEVSEQSQMITTSEDSEDQFATPTSGNSDAEDMEDAQEIPDTFIYPGSIPTKTDYAVLEAIEKVPLPREKYQYIYLWRLILQMQPKNNFLIHHLSSPDVLQKRCINFDSPKSSPRKFLDKSFGSCDSPSIQAVAVEPWERVTGPYSPRRSTRSSLNDDFL